MSRRSRNLTAFLLVLVALGIGIFWLLKSHRTGVQEVPATGKSANETKVVPATRDQSATRIHAHNLLLRKGDQFRVYVRWLNGSLQRTARNVDPSFDNPDSFRLQVESGVVRANIGDIGQFLSTGIPNSPLQNVKLLADGPNVKLTGTIHKGISLPVEVIASVSATPDDRVRVHVDKIQLLKLPMKGMLGLFHVSTAELVKANIDGLEIKGDDLLFTTQKLLPPPHLWGRLTNVRVDSPDIEVTFGDAGKDLEEVETWRNFFSLKGGTIDFGALTMHPVNIMMIDISSNPWFDLDLMHYRDQLTNGYTRMTADSGLQMFIPDRRDVPATTPPASDSIQWFKDRNIPVPKQITQGKK